MGAKTFTSGNGRIVVPYPTDSRWEVNWDFTVIPIPGMILPGTAELVKARRTAPGEFLFMLAKDYLVIGSEETAMELSTTIYRNSYERQFDNVTYTRHGPTEHQGHLAYEAEITMSHHVRGRIKKIERVAVHDSHVLLTSAEGNPAPFDRHLSDITQWVRDTTFAELS